MRWNSIQNKEKKIGEMLLFLFLFFISYSVFCQKKSGKEQLFSEINAVYNEGIFNGFAVAIVNDKGTLYKKGFGFADKQIGKKYTEKTIQNIASVSKIIVGIALLKAQELGKLNLDDPIEKYLSFNVVNPKFPDEKITIRQLATHTSSIADNDFYLSKNYFLKANQNLTNVKLRLDDEQVFNPADSIISMGLFLENMLSENGKWNKNSFTEHKPGSIYEYSNIGTALAAYIVENATGESFQDFTKKHILKPLNMHHSGWKFEDVQFSNFSNLYENSGTLLSFYEMITFPDGGFITSVSDLSKLLTELIKGYNKKGNGAFYTIWNLLEKYQLKLGK